MTIVLHVRQPFPDIARVVIVNQHDRPRDLVARPPFRLHKAGPNQVSHSL
jgi:hypothetical protein